MEFTDKGIELTVPEARNLAEVMDWVAMRDTYSNGRRMLTQSSEQLDGVRRLRDDISPYTNPETVTDGVVLITEDRFAVLRRAAEVAVNTCKGYVEYHSVPNLADGFYPSMVPEAFEILGMTASIGYELTRRLPTAAVNATAEVR